MSFAFDLEGLPPWVCARGGGYHATGRGFAGLGLHWGRDAPRLARRPLLRRRSAKDETSRVVKRG